METLAEWKGPDDRLVVASFAMTPPEQHALTECIAQHHTATVQISRLDPAPDHPEWPSLIVRLFNKGNTQGWGYRIWPSGNAKRLSGGKPTSKG